MTGWLGLNLTDSPRFGYDLKFLVLLQELAVSFESYPNAAYQ